MPTRLRPLATLALALILAITSVHWALGRAEAAGAQDLVICSDGSIATITLGADGKPVSRHHACPDCVLGGLALGSAALAPASPPQARARRASLPRPHRPRQRRPVAARARAPPAALA